MSDSESEMSSHLSNYESDNESEQEKDEIDERFNNFFYKDKDFTSQVNAEFRKKFNKDISSGADLAIGYALTQKPGGLIKSEAADYDWETKFNKTQAAINARAADDEEDYVDPVDQYLSDARLGKTFAGVEGENIEIMNLPEIILKDLGKDKRPAIVGRGLNDNQYYSIVYQKERDKKTGKPTGVNTDIIDWGKTQIIPESQIRASVVSRALPSGSKVKLVRGKNKSGKKKKAY